MGCQQSKTDELTEKRILKLHQKMQDMEKNIKDLVEIINNTPGKTIQVDHIKINKSILLQNDNSEDFIYLSFDKDTNKLKVEKNNALKQPQCTIM